MGNSVLFPSSSAAAIRMQHEPRAVADTISAGVLSPVSIVSSRPTLIYNGLPLYATPQSNCSGVMDIEHPRLDRGPSEFDVRHRFVGSGIWDLASPKSKGAASKALEGWQLNAIVTLQSGRPFDVDRTLGWYAGCDFNMDGGYYARPNLPAEMKLSGFSNQQLVDGLFGSPALSFYGATYESRTSAVIVVFCPDGLNSIIDFGPSATCIPAGSNGNLGCNRFRGPAFKDVDLGLFKNTKVGEHLSIQSRAEAFNLFNRANLYNPIGNMGSPFQPSQHGSSSWG
jgi:hypothetical protein